MTNHPDLFGGNTPTATPVHGPYKNWKIDHNFRDCTFPASSCKNCKWLVVRKFSKTYYKCGAMGVSNSASTDIRLKNVCDLFQAEVKK